MAEKRSFGKKWHSRSSVFIIGVFLCSDVVAIEDDKADVLASSQIGANQLYIA